MTCEEANQLVWSLIDACLNENVREVEILLYNWSTVGRDISSLINSLGITSGESAAHIAISKNNPDLLKLLIDYGADPNCRNRASFTLVHSAANLGHLHLLRMLYGTGKANLELLTEDDLSVIDVVDGAISPDIVANHAHRFLAWQHGKNHNDGYEITKRRKECKRYLQINIMRDQRAKIDMLTNSTNDWMIKRHTQKRYFDNYTEEYVVTYSVGIEYPEQEGIDVLSRTDQASFDRYRIGVHRVAQNLAIHDIVHNGIAVGQNRTLHRILATEKS